MPGFLHLYVGQEAVAAGVCVALHPDDQITSTHRGHGHLVAKGGDLRRMMAELMGKATGYCNGKGGSMHICDLDLNMLGANGIVGGMDAVAVYEATLEAVGRARRGEGPYFVECKTYRYYNHHGVQTLGAKYRSDEEVEEWRQRDAIDHHEKRLIESGVMTAADLQTVREEIQDEVDDAVQFGEDSPMPDPSTILDDVYSVGGAGGR